MKVTNKSKALQGVRTDKGLAWLKPGESRNLELSGPALARAEALPFLVVEAKPAKAKPQQPQQ